MASTDSISSNYSISRRQEHNLVKELHEILNKFFAWLIGVVLLVNSDSGNALFKEHDFAMMGVVSATALLFLAWVLVTLLQKHLRNFLPIIILLLLQSVVCVLSLSAVSLAIAVIALALWLCVFGLIAYFKLPEVYQLFPEMIKSWIVGYNPQSARLPPEIHGHQRPPLPPPVWAPAKTLSIELA